MQLRWPKGGIFLSVSWGFKCNRDFTTAIPKGVSQSWNRDEAMARRIFLSLTGSLARRRIGALATSPAVLSRASPSSLSAF